MFILLLGACIACSGQHSATSDSGLDGSDGAVSDGAGSDGTASDGAGSDGTGPKDSPYEPWVDWKPDPKTMTYSLHVGSRATIYEPKVSDEIAGFPRAYAIDTGSVEAPTRTVIASFSQNPDDADAELVVSKAVSEDGGETFETVQVRSQYPNYILRQPSGAILDVGFRPNSAEGNELLIQTAISNDDGQTWLARESLVTLDAAIKPLGRTHRGLTMLDDGSSVIPHYATLDEDIPVGKSVFLLRTQDEGLSFSEQGVIAPYAGTLAFNETTVVRTTRGDLLAVFRAHETNPTKVMGLRFARSGDDGGTWTAPKPLQIAFGSNSPKERIGVDPTLTLMPNGVLVLSAGRPDNWVAFSWDGTGDTWEDGTITYVNRPTGSMTRGSSGYTGFASTESNRAVLIGDNCAPSWGCPDNYSGFTVDNRYRVWRRMVEVVTPGVGKIDLAGKYRTGAITASGNLEFRSPAHPRIGLAAAFDGSTEPWSAALQKGAQPGELTLELDRVYRLHRIGLLLAWGREANATVTVSLDGTNWSKAIVETETRHAYALEYFELERAARARFVRIEVDATQCPPGIEGDCAALGELELYGDVDSFENDAIGAIPRGYAGSKLGSVVLSGDDAHGRVLRIHDSRSDEHAHLLYEGQEGEDAQLSFALAPQALAQAFLFDVLGTNQEGETVAAYHLGVFSDGSVKVWDDGEEVWTVLSEPGLVAVGTWSDISITASLEQALIQVNGQTLRATPPSVTGVTKLVGHSFASAGTKPVGDDVFIDDVWYDVSSTPGTP